MVCKSTHTSAVESSSPSHRLSGELIISCRAWLLCVNVPTAKQVLTAILSTVNHAALHLMTDYLGQCRVGVDLLCTYFAQSCGSVSLISSVQCAQRIVSPFDRCVIPGVCPQTNTVQFLFRSPRWLGQQIFEVFL